MNRKGCFGKNVFERDGSELCTKGLHLDVPAWRHHVFEVLAV